MACSFALARLAETDVAQGNHEAVQELLAALGRSQVVRHPVSSGRPPVRRQLLAAATLDALPAPKQRERALAGDLVRARQHLVEVERISGLWQGGPWISAFWQGRAEIRRGEGQEPQASALFLEAAASSQSFVGPSTSPAAEPRR